MTSKRNAQTNQQQKSEKTQGSGILQRVAVRSVTDAGMRSTDENEALALSNSAFSNDFSQVPISTTKPQPIMAKLMIGAVGDKYEQEADRVAAQVVQRINAPASVQSGESETTQRKEKGTKDNKTKLMRSPIVQRKSSDSGMAAPPDVEASINQARGGGQPMADHIRKPMEQAFGADFSKVKVHTDAQSDQLNRSIQARAFTTGRDVFFRQGEYNPGSRGGQELIAHELTHVVQQRGGAVQREKMREGGKTSGDKGKIAVVQQEEYGLSEPEGQMIQRAVTPAGHKNQSEEATGKFSYTFNWNTSNPHNQGYIIQKITRSTEETIGNDTVSDNYTYWEAWEVRENEIYSNNVKLTGPHDTWAGPVMQADSGKVKISAEVYFSPSSQDEISKTMKYNTIPDAGGLLSSSSEPSVKMTHLFSHGEEWPMKKESKEKREANVKKLIGELAKEYSDDWLEHGESLKKHSDDSDEWEQFASIVNEQDYIKVEPMTLETIRQVVKNS